LLKYFLKLAGLLKYVDVILSKLLSVREYELVAVDSLKVMRGRVERLAGLHFLSLWLTKQDDLSVLDQLC
jgi:hypothetical protein